MRDKPDTQTCAQRVAGIAQSAVERKDRSATAFLFTTPSPSHSRPVPATAMNSMSYRVATGEAGETMDPVVGPAGALMYQSRKHITPPR